MNKLHSKTEDAPTNNTVNKNKLHPILQSLIYGTVVTLIGLYGWLFLSIAVPFPWMVFAVLGFLVVYILFMAGRIGWESTKKYRKEAFRKVNLASDSVLGIGAGILFVFIIQSSFMLTFRIIPIPTNFDTGYSFNEMTQFQAWIFILLASLVAGIVEEIGFRGYGQVVLEKKYSSFIAVSFTSSLFLVAHLHQVWAPPLLVHIFGAGILLGTLAYATQSLVPGIFAHVIMDIINFSVWWTDVLRPPQYSLVTQTGIDTPFVIGLVVLVISMAAFWLVIWKLIQKEKISD